MKPTLFILMGREVEPDFWSDADTFKELDFDTQIDILEKTFRWFGMEKIEDEWNKWVKDLEEEEVEKRSSAVKFILYITKQALRRKVPDEKLQDDLEKLVINQSTIEKYIQLKKEYEGEFLKEMAEQASKVFASAVDEVDWRIERIVMTPYQTDIEDTILMLRLQYFDSTGKKRREIFQFSENGFEAFIDTLQKALESVKKVNAC